MKLRARLALFFSIPACVMALALVILVSTLITDMDVSDRQAGYQTLVGQMYKSASLLLRDAEQKLFTLYYNQDLAQAMRVPDADPLRAQNIQMKLRFMCYSSDLFDVMYALSPNGDLQGATSHVSLEHNAALAADFLARYDWLAAENTRWFYGVDGALYLKKDVNVISPLKRQGLLIARLSMPRLMTLLGFDDYPDGVLGILLEDGTPLLTSAPLPGGLSDTVVCTLRENGATGAREVRDASGGGWWLTSIRTGSEGIIYYHLKELRETRRVADAMASLALTTGLCALALTLLIAVFVSRGITRGLSRLLESVSRVSAGDFSTPINISGRDEIAQLARQFQWMQARLSEITRESIRKATEKQRAEYDMLELKYRSLQSQIGPHFICNVLSSVQSLSAMGQQDKVGELAVMASRYLRENLSGMDEKESTLRQELRYAFDYTFLYRAIYGDCFTFDADVSGACYCATLPKMTLQPLVENALVHGQRVGETLSLHVTARHEGAYLALTLADDGCGMSRETIDAALSGSEMMQRRATGFGIRSVSRRLKLLYGDDQGFDIVSDGASGTTIHIRVPWRIYKENDET